ncbi:MAG: phosphate uptake regulator PhoU [Candidatus Bathyarchaeia archaeon]
MGDWDGMEIRRVQKTPDGTFFITIPKEWTSGLGLSKGSAVRLVNEGGRISIEPWRGDAAQGALREAVIHPSPLIGREIVEKYLSGYDLIRIRSDSVIDSKSRERIKAALKTLIGMEILEEDSKNIVIQCVIEPELLNPGKILRRLHSVAASMQADSLRSMIDGDAELASTVVERDEEVDRLYFLLVRALRASLSEGRPRRPDSPSPKECMDYRLLATYIEAAADCAVAIAGLAREPAVRLNGEQAAAMAEAGRRIHEAFKGAFEAVLSGDLESASRIHHSKPEMEGELIRLGKSLLEGPAEAEAIFGLLGSLTRMCEISVDMADLTASR